MLSPSDILISLSLLWSQVIQVITAIGMIAQISGILELLLVIKLSLHFYGVKF